MSKLSDPFDSSPALKANLAETEALADWEKELLGTVEWDNEPRARRERSHSSRQSCKGFLRESRNDYNMALADGDTNSAEMYLGYVKMWERKLEQ